MIASREILKRRQEHSRRRGITARRLADFLISVESEEVLLQQRLRDRDSTAIRSSSTIERPVAVAEAVQQDQLRAEVDTGEPGAVANLQTYGEFGGCY